MNKKEFLVLTPRQWLALVILGLIACVFAGGGILLGSWFNYVTTGVWFF